ncbi:MAG TPA: FmdB family zinc ribbon protein [Thermoanaerobaculia bacterium]|jgi:putative FmdB family regulatory protein|nr:FmdB family zinc ribbon protein [Thermoanaerobaculia bacterium]
MPIYEYECLSCGKRTEAIQKMNDGPIAACPACGGEVKKLISSPAFQFKGSGWYVTDYGGKKGPEGKHDHKSEGKSEGHSEGKGEGRSEGKGEGKSDGGGEGKSESKSEKAAPAESKASSGGGSSGGTE